MAQFAVVCITSSVVLLGLASPAVAAGSTTVSKASGLDPAGDRITVRGSGFDVTKGIYVAVCVDRGPGVAPSPCIGGVDQGGGGGSSAWISSNPPAYGQGLATPYGPGGAFSVTLSVVGRDPVTGTDCTVVRCAAVTRADHTRSGDRSQDTRVALSFAAPAPPPAPPQPAPRPTTRPPAAQPPAATTVAPAPTTAAAPTATSDAAAATTTTPASSGPSATTGSRASATSAVAEAAGTSGGPPAWLLVLLVAAVAAAVAVTAWLLRRRRTPAGPPPPSVG